MNFDFNEEQRSLGETVGQLLADFPALTAPEPARSQDDEVWSALAELGLFSLLVPEENDGVGLSLVDLALSVEALGAGMAPPLVASTLIATELVKRLGSDAQKGELFEALATGTCKVAIAYTERGRGTDPAKLACSAAGGRLNGSKIAVAGADKADKILVAARDGERAQLVLVDAGTAGASIRLQDDLDPSAGLCAVTFDNVEISAEAVLGAADGDAAVKLLIDIASTVIGGLTIGIASRMLDITVEYAKTREQFGKPIGSFQALKHRCADLAVAVEAGSATAYFAFWSCAQDNPDRSKTASAAKAYCADIARDACNEAIQIHGGMGFTWELALHRYLRRAKVLESAFGNPHWHYRRVHAEALAARDAD